MADEVPDFFKDPMDKIMRESEEAVKKLLIEYNDIHKECTFWTGHLIGSYLDAAENKEENPPSMEQMRLGEAVKTNFLLMKIVKLLSEKGKGNA